MIEPDLHVALLAWTELRCQVHPTRAASRLYGILASGGQIWQRIANGVASALSARFSCLTGMIAMIDRTTLLPSGRLGEWLLWSDQIASIWREGASPPWNSLLVDLAREENQLATTCVSQSLAHSGAASASRILEACALELASLDAGHWSGLPVPPAEGRSWDPGDYLFHSIHSELLAQAASFSDRLMDDRELLSEKREYLQGTLPRAKWQSSTWAAATADLREVVQWVRTGWPVERKMLFAPLQRLTTPFRAVHSPLEDAFSKCELLSAEMAKWEGGADDVKVQAMALENSALSVQSEDKPFRELLAQDLTQLAESLVHATDDSARKYGERLKELAKKCSDGPQEGGTKRQLLSLLVELDSDVATPGRRHTWQRATQEYLRNLLVTRGEYVLLERQLVGQRIESCAGVVEVVGYVGGGKNSNHIAAVRQPGYALRRSDGTEQVLHTARVLLGE